MLIQENCEMFYTEAIDSNDDDLVDQISIDKVNKEFLLQTGDMYVISDGFFPSGREVSSWHVSRLVFDIIVQGIKEGGFKEAQYVR